MLLDPVQLLLDPFIVAPSSFGRTSKFVESCAVSGEGQEI